MQCEFVSETALSLKQECNITCFEDSFDGHCIKDYKIKLFCSMLQFFILLYCDQLDYSLKEK